METKDTRKCPYCAEIIKSEAIKCKHCLSDLTKEAKPEPSTVNNGKEDSEPKRFVQPAQVNSKELLQRAYDVYNKASNLDGALKLCSIIIIHDANSQEANEVKSFISKRLTSKELLEKACKLHFDSNDLSGAFGLYKLVIGVFPESAGVEYANRQIEALNKANVDYVPDSNVSYRSVNSFAASKEDRNVAIQNALLWGTLNATLVCPHCQQKGSVRTKEVKRKKGISGAKATGVLLTGGLSIFATGLSRKEATTQAHCGKCNVTWDI